MLLVGGDLIEQDSPILLKSFELSAVIHDVGIIDIKALQASIIVIEVSSMETTVNNL